MTSNSTPTPLIHQNVIPSEVGWQFVPQYYTYVNQQPNRLHRFYTKASTFIHGVEGEDGKPSFGQQEIHNKITSIGFQDCKVFIHSVDAQSSASGGIIIQVIGEMSNRGEEWRKFVQTFFLAEQPNGYFVLNDIFRFLKEEAVESDAASDGEPVNQEPVSVAPIIAQPEPAAPVHTPVPPPEEHPVEPTPVPAPVPEEAPNLTIPEPVISSPAPEPHVNGFASPPVTEPEPKPETTMELPTPAESEPEPTTVSPPPVASPTLAPATLAPQPPSASTPTTYPTAAQPSQPPQPAAPAPPQPKTWANLAAANSKKWGAAVAQESRGTSEVPASPVVPRSASQTPVGPGPGPGGAGRGAGPGPQRDMQSAYAAAQNITHPQCFVKGVIDNVTQLTLTQVLTTRFGPVKDVEIVRSKACAFLEFTSLDAAKRAIIASLPIPQGGEGGVRIDLEGGGQARIVVETKKERGERPPSNRPRMNGPGGGPEMRGGFRGRGGPGGTRGRGGGGPGPK